MVGSLKTSSVISSWVSSALLTLVVVTVVGASITLTGFEPCTFSTITP